MIPLLLLHAALAAPGYGDQIVTLSVTTQNWEPTQPWMKTNPVRRSAQAVMVAAGGDTYLLTTAKMVENATLVQTKKHGEPNEVLATVRYVDREADLALLSVEEPSFFSDLAPVRFTRRPVGEGTVAIGRWKESQLEVSEGRVARASTFNSPTGILSFAGLRVTTDMSAGGWAEPVFVGGRLAGLSLGQSGSELSVMPADFIEHWLKAVVQEGQVPRWVGDLGISAQAIRSPALAQWLGLEAPAGILVLGVQQGASACGSLQRGDVILAVDGMPLDGSGSVRDPLYGLLSYEYLLTHHVPGGTLDLSILRDHQRQELKLPLRSYTGDQWLIPVDRIAPPPYLMAGGLVFREYDESYTARSVELRIVSLDSQTAQTPSRRRVVVLASVLPDSYNLGYHALSDLWVEAVNGQPIDGLDDVQAALAHPVQGYHVFTFHPNPRIAEVVLDAATFEAATRSIAASYGVPEVSRLGAPPPDLGPACAAP